LQIGPAKAAIFHSLENRLSARIWQASVGGGLNIHKRAFSFLDFARISPFHSGLKDLAN
jgi:hypothetical protein